MELAGFNDSLEKDKSVTSVQGWSKEKSAEALGDGHQAGADRVELELLG